MRVPFAHEGTRVNPRFESSIWLYMADLTGIRFFLRICDRVGSMFLIGRCSVLEPDLGRTAG